MILFGDLMALQFFDSEFHIFDRKFPLSKNYFHQMDSFTVSEYQLKLSQDLPDLQIEGGAIVSHRLQRFDQSYLLDALEKFGEAYIGITQLPTDYPQSAIESLNRQRVRGVKFELTTGDTKRKVVIEDFLKSVFDLCNWGGQFTVDVDQYFEWSSMIESLVQQMPMSISIKGNWQLISKDVFRLIEKGVRIKIIDCLFDEAQFIPALKQLLTINHESVLLATGLPVLDESDQKLRFHSNTLQRLLDEFEVADVSRMLFQNSKQFYGLEKLGKTN